MQCFWDQILKISSKKVSVLNVSVGKIYVFRIQTQWKSNNARQFTNPFFRELFIFVCLKFYIVAFFDKNHDYEYELEDTSIRNLKIILVGCRI